MSSIAYSNLLFNVSKLSQGVIKPSGSPYVLFYQILQVIVFIIKQDKQVGQ